MSSEDLWWWLIFFAIVCSGAFGGYARYQWEKGGGVRPQKAKVFVVTGIAASFLVPLFLNTISSSLLKAIPDEPEKMFLLIGFCVAAGAFSRQFIDTVGAKALKISQQASEQAAEAKQIAGAAETEARKADNRAVALYRVLQLIEAENYLAALKEVDEVVSTDPNSSEAWAWRGYCLKRLKRFQEAATSMEHALKEEGRDAFTWVYNLACYRCLANAPAQEVIGILQRALLVATDAQRQQFADDVSGDDDFAILRATPEYPSFITSLKGGK